MTEYTVTKNYDECDDFCVTVCFFKDREVEQVKDITEEYETQLQQYSEADEHLYYVFKNLKTTTEEVAFLRDLHANQNDYKSFTVCADKAFMN